MAASTESGSSTSEVNSIHGWAAPPFCGEGEALATWKLKIGRTETVMERRRSTDPHALQAMSQVSPISFQFWQCRVYYRLLVS
jgi:hypothetical protein